MRNSAAIIFLFGVVFMLRRAVADEPPRFDIPVPQRTAGSLNSQPPELNGVAFEQRLGQSLPLDAAFVDETGRSVHLGDYFGRRPILLAFVQYRCPMLCTQVLNGQCRAMNACALEPGSDYDVLTISIDPRETSQLASAKKHLYDAQVSRAGTHAAWHFLTGNADNIRLATEAAGFHYVYDARLDQFIHASGIMLVTPDGRMSKYLFGIEYSPNDLRLGVATARLHQSGTLSDAFLLYCFHYDPIHGRYTLAVTRVLSVAGGITALVLGVFVVRELARDRSVYTIKSNDGGLS